MPSGSLRPRVTWSGCPPMREALTLPRVGMNMDEGTVARWHVAAGHCFAAGDPLYDLETDKVVQVVEAATAGRLVEIVVPDGEDAAVGATIAIIETEAS